MQPARALGPAPPKQAGSRAQFLAAWEAFCAARGLEYAEDVAIRKLPFDLFEIWHHLRQHGGFQAVTERRGWAALARAAGLPHHWTNTSTYLRNAVSAAGLAAFEEALDAADAQLVAAFTAEGGDDAAAAAPLPPPAVQPLDVAVRCGTVHGVCHVLRQRVTCLCDACLAHSGAGGCEMSLTEFERHGGLAAYKKWRKSIVVSVTGRTLGSWLQKEGIVLPSTSAASKAATSSADAAAVLSLQHQQLPLLPQQQPPVLLQGQLPQVHAPHSNVLGRESSSSSEDAVQLGHTQLLDDGLRATAPSEPLDWQQQQRQRLPLLPEPQQLPWGWHSGAAASSSSMAPAAALQLGGGGAASSLVGRRIAVWWPLDGAWYPARCEAFDAAKGLHTLRYEDDGDVETVNLAAEQWRLEMELQQYEQQQQRQQLAAAEPAAAVAEPPCLLDHLDALQLPQLPQLPQPSAALQPPEQLAAATVAEQPQQDSDAAWWAAAQRSAAERPLRVVFDAATACLRVLPAETLLAAEWQQRQAAAPQAVAPQAAAHGWPHGSWGGAGSAALQPQRLQAGARASRRTRLLDPAVALPGATTGSVAVVCGSKQGSLMPEHLAVVCHCVECVAIHAETGELCAWAPAAWERHGGLGSSKRWRSSIKVLLPASGGGQQRTSLGSWLDSVAAQAAQAPCWLPPDLLQLQLGSWPPGLAPPPAAASTADGAAAAPASAWLAGGIGKRHRVEAGASQDPAPADGAAGFGARRARLV